MSLTTVLHALPGDTQETRAADPKNRRLLAERVAAYDVLPGPREGDWIRHPDGRLDRITHVWPDTVQTGGNGGSYYLGRGFVSYSGGLDPGIPIARLIDMGETHPGPVWFFDRDYARAAGGVEFSVPFRVYNLTGGAP